MLVAAASFVLWGQVGHAQEVTLSFPDGSFEISGSLLSFDGDAYRVESRFGVLTVSAESVDCAGACPDGDAAPIIRLAGATALTEVLAPALVDAFARSLGLTATPVPTDDIGKVALALATAQGAPVATFEISGSSASGGFEALIAGQADIVLSDRTVSDIEANRALELGLGDLRQHLRRRLIARRLFRLVVPDSFDAPDVTVSELLDIASGRAMNWEEVGGPDRPVALATLSSDLDAITSRFADLARFEARPTEFQSQSLETFEDGISFLAQTPGAALLTHETVFSGRPVSLSHGCEPGSANRAKGDDNPLVIHLWAYTGAARLPDLGRAFLIFASGPEAQRVIDRAGFIDKRPRPISLDDQGGRIARAVAMLSPELPLDDLKSAVERIRSHDRLSNSFRFRPGTTELTQTSESVAQGLAALLDSGRYDGRELLFLGMTDSIGSAAANRDLSETRAQVVLEAVQNAMATRSDRLTMVAEGRGEIFPLACDVTAWGRHVNRRVEVWLGPTTR